MSDRLFVSWVRRGASAGIVTEDPLSGAIGAAPAIRPHLSFKEDDASPVTVIEGPALQMLGPAHVIGFNRQLITRVEPGAGATNGQSNELAYVEFSRPDLPWLFTPAAPNRAAHQRLRPWLVLIVVPEGSWERLDETASPLAVLEVSTRELQDLSDSWAWAHAQVAAPDEAGARAAIRGRAAETRSRLLCPRQLREESRYRAFVVPGFEGGRRAGLGDPGAADPATAFGPAWTTATAATVTLPVYYSWRFATGPREGFEDLASRLKRASVQALAGFGTREVDVRQPFPALPSLAALASEDAAAPQTVAMDGALKIPGEPPAGSMSAAVRAKFESVLEKQLNFPSTVGGAARPTDPELRSVTAPIYGSRFRGLPKLPDTPGWVRDLNLDIRRRIAAGHGTRYVQEHQEFLMARAWEQLPEIQRANRLRRLGELAAVTADALHRRHVTTLTAPELIAVAAPARARTRAADRTTLQQAIAASPLPNAAATPAFTRLARPRGPIARGTGGTEVRRMVERGLAGQVAINQQRTLTRRLSAAIAQPEGAGDATSRRAAATSRLVAGVERHAVAIGLSSLQRMVDTRGAQAAPSLAGANNILVQRLGGVLSPQMLRTESAAAVAARLQQPDQTGIAIAAVTRFGEYLVEARGDTVALRPQAPPPPPTGTPLVAGTLHAQIASALTPSRLILKRLGDRITVPPEMQPADPLGPVMAGPHFDAPLALPLFQKQPNLLLPGIGSFPADSVTLLETNPPFIESLLAGANHEMNRELLWREFPTDQRGTPFRHFWPRPGGAPEIGAIASWTGRLGGNLSGGVGEQIVLLVRGEVLRRFPGTIVFAAPARRAPGGTFDLVDARALPPEFAMRLTADTSIYAFRLTEEAVKSGAGQDGWFFVFQEPLTTPRFGFDLPAPAAPFASWDDLTWDRVPMDRGQFAFAGGNLTAPPDSGNAAWNRTAADVARIALQRPFRLGFHADVLLGGA